jgi:NadR type nicotinamide-nucleotide adenylyltransferase
MLKIVITGAESTGKSTLAQAMAKHFDTIWIPELARAYVEKLECKYSYSDIESIARLQIETEKNIQNGHKLVFFDTWLIITKVWFDFVYGKHPDWLDVEIAKSKIGLFLVCDIDMPWIEDPVRENGGENRKILHQIYINELKTNHFNYKIISGIGSERINNAISIVSSIIDPTNQLMTNDKHHTNENNNR